MMIYFIDMQTISTWNIRNLPTFIFHRFVFLTLWDNLWNIKSGSRLKTGACFSDSRERDEYKCHLKDSQVDIDTLRECDQIGFIFQYNLPWGQANSSFGAAVLGSQLSMKALTTHEDLISWTFQSINIWTHSCIFHFDVV